MSLSLQIPWPAFLFPADLRSKNALSSTKTSLCNTLPLEADHLTLYGGSHRFSTPSTVFLLALAVAYKRPYTSLFSSEHHLRELEPRRPILLRYYPRHLTDVLQISQAPRYRLEYRDWQRWASTPLMDFLPSVPGLPDPPHGNHDCPIFLVHLLGPR